MVLLTVFGYKLEYLPFVNILMLLSTNYTFLPE